MLKISCSGLITEMKNITQDKTQIEKKKKLNDRALKEINEIKLWDILFFVTMLVTMFALEKFRIREMIQIAFMGISFWKIRLKPDLVCGFMISRVLFLLWCALSFIWALYPAVVLRYMISVTQSTVLSMALIIYLTSDRKRLNYACLLFGICSLLLIGYLLRSYSFSQILHADLTSSQRFTAGSLNPNQVGICCSYSLLVLYWNIDRIRKNLLWYTGGWILIAVFGLFSLITGSKKALITLVFGMFLLMILKSKDAYRTILRIVLAFAFGAAIIWAIFNIHFLYETIGQRFMGLINYFMYGSGDKSTYSRGAMIRQARQVFLENPILGIGLHNFKEINIYGVYAHNNYWELLVCLGIPGFLFYYLPMLSAIGNSISGFFRNKKQYVLVNVLLICFFINEYATVSYTNEVIQIVLTIILSMVILSKEKENRDE